ncbi:MAG: ABC transporter ATP-binding protein [Proteobacteria bacterium]|jgi:ABC-2 type transport system ATP-binding protein|nr:ABC transporter ATP-binding protein [Pseudomonadota bacterium]
MTVLSVRHLSKSFKSGFFEPAYKVLADISFKIEKGRATGFVGLNGAGKTTTLKCILGFIRPQSGSIELNRQSLGYLPERPCYYDFLTAKEFLEFFWKLSVDHSDGFEKACDNVLKEVGLLDSKHVLLKKFSKGMLQRVGLAQALIHHPEVLILDEPMSGLDPDGRIRIKEILFRQKALGRTIFFSSHLLSDMEELCEDLVIIHKGKIVYTGSLESFKKTESLESSFKQLRQQLEGRG